MMNQKKSIAGIEKALERIEDGWVDLILKQCTHVTKHKITMKYDLRKILNPKITLM